MQNNDKDSNILTEKIFRRMWFIGQYGFDPDKPIQFEKESVPYLAVVNEDYTQFYVFPVAEQPLEFKIEELDLSHYWKMKRLGWG